MQQTTINGYRVMIFTGYDGTQLFVNNPDGDTIYAHRVSGDALARAREVIASDMPETIEAPAPMVDRMICVSERKAEFREALNRGKDNKFEVFADWDKDAFVVVNQGNQAEYRVHLESRENQFFASCECPDFFYKKRLCKHIGCVLTEMLFSVRV